MAFDRRLTVHLLLQPVIAEKILESRLMVEQGILARFLIVWPESLAGDRLYDQYNVYEESDALGAFHAKLTGRLEQGFQTTDSGGCLLGLIKPNKEAQLEYIRFYNRIETSIKGKNFVVEAVASKAAENALRIAGVRACIQDRAIIDIHTMRAGTKLAEYYLDQQRILARRTQVDGDERLALDMWHWLRTKKDPGGVSLCWNGIVDIESLQKRLPGKMRKSVQLIRRLMARLDRQTETTGVFCIETNQKGEPKTWFVGESEHYEETFAELQAAESAESAETEE